MDDRKPLRVRRGHPRSFGYMKVSVHPDGSETWEAPDGTLKRFAPGRLELVSYRSEDQDR